MGSGSGPRPPFSRETVLGAGSKTALLAVSQGRTRSCREEIQGGGGGQGQGRRFTPERVCLEGEGQLWPFKGSGGRWEETVGTGLQATLPPLGHPAPALLAQVSLLSQQTSLPCGPGRAFLAGSVVLAPGWQAVDIW